MKLLLHNSPSPSKHTLLCLISLCLISLAQCILPSSIKACDRAELTLDSVVCEGGNYRIYVELCLGGGITGTAKGADADTRTMGFGFYTSAASMAIHSFSPASITGDSSGISMPGAIVGPGPFGTQEFLLYLDPNGSNGFMCVSSTNQCGNLHTQCDQYSFLVDVIPDSIRLFGAEGNGNAFGGCYPNSDMVISMTSINPLLAPFANAGLDTLICRGDTLTLGAAPVLGAYSYSWSPPTYIEDDTLANPLAWPQSTTTYSLVVSQSSLISGCASDTDSVTVTVDTACVWPGDCNYDLVANYLDILPIGLAYNNVGPIRPIPGNGWFGHPAFDWSGSFINGPNFKHADSNGDGLINLFDVTAIFANYGQTHTGNRVHTQNGGMIFYALPDTIQAGDTLWIIAGLGTPAHPVDSVYGLGFQLFYPPALVDSGSVVVRYDSSWLGTESVDLITLDVDQYQSGVVDVGMTRIDHVDRGGHGEICRIGIAMQDDISAKMEAIIEKWAIFRFDGIVSTSADESQRVLGGAIDSVLVWQASLPVTWQDFYGTSLSTGINLNWSTALEINSDNFQVERAGIGEDFESIGEVSATGNTSVQQNYEFLDRSPVQGANLYRIMETDQDGSKTYSPTISVQYGESSELSFSLSPKFQDDQLVFTVISPEDQAANYQLFDLQGHQLVNQTIHLENGAQTIHYACENLSSGVYLFHLKSGSSSITNKLIRP